jgi:hypothetical protein
VAIYLIGDAGIAKAVVAVRALLQVVVDLLHQTAMAGHGCEECRKPIGRPLRHIRRTPFEPGLLTFWGILPRL